MNVLDVRSTRVPEMIEGTFDEMLALRHTTHLGFAAVEEVRGGLPSTVSLSTSRGQEVVRTLLMRGFEEMTEALEAISRAHLTEELIDAVNYFWNLLVIDGCRWAQLQKSPLPRLARGATAWGCEILCELLIGQLMTAAAPLLAKLRNRSWQHAPQSLYFDGWKELDDFVLLATRRIMGCFNGWEEFAQTWYAKNEVLSFRLRTRY